MPNGGSDCCGTCWFNVKNKGRAGYDHAKDPGPDRCEIRSLVIEEPFYTYCANHPHRRPQRDPIPIGPVFMGGERSLWQASPDGEAIRQHLLLLLSEIRERPRAEYPIGSHTDDVVVWQLGEFREARAAEALRRVAAFDPEVTDGEEMGRTREALVELAREALAKIEDGSG